MRSPYLFLPQPANNQQQQIDHTNPTEESSLPQGVNPLTLPSLALLAEQSKTALQFSREQWEQFRMLLIKNSSSAIIAAVDHTISNLYPLALADYNGCVFLQKQTILQRAKEKGSTTAEFLLQNGFTEQQNGLSEDALYELKYSEDICYYSLSVLCFLISEADFDFLLV